MARRETPEILGAVSQETADDVAVAMLGGGAPATMHGSTVHWVWLSYVLPNPYQTRLSEDPEHIMGLARSIRAEQANLPDTAGLQQVPLGRLVWRLRDGQVETMQAVDHRPEAVASLLADGACVQLAFGHSRFAAFELLAGGLGRKWPDYPAGAQALHVRAEFLEGDPAYGRLPVRIVHLDDKAMWSQAVRENHERKDLTALEEARAIDMAISALGLTTEQAGRAFGYERSTAANKLRLLGLPDVAKELIQSGWMTERHGRALLRLAPAPHLLAAVISDLMVQRNGVSGAEAETAALLDLRITRLIGFQTAMPVSTVTERREGLMERTHEPQPWPLEWTSRAPAVVGPCAGCQYRVVFGNEGFARCTKNECYQAKKRIWEEQEQERQRLAALAAVNAERPTAPAASAESVEAAPARQIERVVAKSHGISVFGDSDTPAGLLERGLCGKEQCECFCLARLEVWQRKDVERYVRPDAIQAPDVVYACNSIRNLAARKRQLAAILEPEAAAEERRWRADLAARTRRSKDLLRAFYEEIGPAGLASSATVMAKLLSRATSDAAKRTVEEIWEQIFWQVAENECWAVEWDGMERIEKWGLTTTQRWIERLRLEIAGRPAQPGPGDSQATGWESDWVETDERLWDNLRSMGDSWSHDCVLAEVDRPRVVLRLIEETKDRSLRGKLWRRYNELVKS